MALSAMSRQLLRTSLTTLGVIVGSLILMISLSVGLGVRHIIEEQLEKEVMVRQIFVYAASESSTKKPPEKVKELPGVMGEARRNRLRKERIRRWEEERSHVLKPITQEHVRKIAEFPNVVAVTPGDIISAQCQFNNKKRHAITLAIAPSDKHFPARLVAGRWLRSLDDRGVVVSEYLLYELGIRDEDQVQKQLGKTLRLEVDHSQASPLVFLQLVGQSAKQLTAEDRELLKEVFQELPKAIVSLQKDPKKAKRLKELLMPKEKKLFQSLGLLGIILEKVRQGIERVLPKTEQQKPHARVQYLKICGVVRMPIEGDPRAFWHFRAERTDLVISSEVGKELVLQTISGREGFQNVIVEVDRPENVPDVDKALKDMKLETSSFAEFIKQQQISFLLVFASMTLIALVALLVAALGITNTMLMSVLERVREIGIMKAVGAQDRHVLWIFLLEGALIGFVGGLLGALLTLGVASISDHWTRSIIEQQFHRKFDGSLFVFPWWLLLGVPLFVASVTTLAAVLPARRASRVNPVTALRHE